MLDEYFHREDVKAFMNELKTNPKYLKLGVHKDSLYGKCMKDELALYLFYDVIIKYKIIIDDPYLFNDFLSQIEKLFRKINNYDDMVHGINKIIGNFVSMILDIHDREEERNTIISYIYDKYIINGYFVHGFSTAYENSLNTGPFEAGNYLNDYESMIEVKNIFSKYNVDIMDKDFLKTDVFFTDDFVMGCFYSVTSPGYFYQLLFNEHVYGNSLMNRTYLENLYNKATLNIKKYMSNEFKDSDKRRVLEVVSSKWRFIHSVPRKVSLLFVKRNRISNVSYEKLDELLNSSLSLYEVLDKLFNCNYRYIEFDGILNRDEYQIISLDDFYKSEEGEKVSKKVEQEFSLSDTSGMISMCLIAGALLITMGVIISIFFIVRGI